MSQWTATPLESFVDYCREHPEERFWQALRNWSGAAFIYHVREFEGPMEDTFYWKDEMNGTNND